MRLIAKFIRPGIAATGLQGRGLANATAIELGRTDIEVASLPPQFDGYQILHLSDIHVGQVTGLIERAAGIVSQLQADLAILNGDIQTDGTPSADLAIEQVKPLLDAIRVHDGIIGVLGNHDSHDIVEHLESRGVRMLINEHVSVDRSGARLHFTGTDDVHLFYSDDAEHALQTRPDGCAIAVVHSPEMADVAADAGYAAYISGHTHGGQICLPNGMALYTALDRHRGLARGSWQYGKMPGYTSRGLGVALPVRFNCPPEITILRLRSPMTRASWPPESRG
jgi:predicted MPP superfamily phosphohydrolase